jgi:ATP-dependent Clp protease ATP-binding subunit ClpB
MRPDKFTQKMQEALQAAQEVASQFSQQEISNQHFLLALLDQTDGLAHWCGEGWLEQRDW